MCWMGSFTWDQGVVVYLFWINQLLKLMAECVLNWFCMTMVWIINLMQFGSMIASTHTWRIMMMILNYGLTLFIRLEMEELEFLAVYLFVVVRSLLQLVALHM